MKLTLKILTSVALLLGLLVGLLGGALVALVFVPTVVVVVTGWSLWRLHFWCVTGR
jgi:hypothetical protein